LAYDTEQMTYKLGVVGLGVMGSNLARNADSKSFPVAGYDLDAGKRQALTDISGGRIATAGCP
jgi:6-phosphogluconate dehydrogenase